MYQKRKKVTQKAFNEKLISVCDELLEFNEDVFLAISKKFVENPDKSLGEEIESLPIIISSISVDKLVIPPSLRLKDGNYITTWCDNDPLIKVIHSKMNFYDGEINGKIFKNLYLDFEGEEIEGIKSCKYV